MDVLGFNVPLWALLVLLLLFIMYFKTTRNFDVWKKQGIPGPKPLPLFGTTLELFKHRSIIDADVKTVQTYGKIVGTFAGSQPALFVADPEFLRQAMIKEFTAMPNRRSFRLPGFFSLALTALRDDHWRHVRQSITPTFTTGKLKQMKPLVDKCGDTLFESIKRLEGKPFKIKTVTGNYTMDVIGSTAFGIHVDSQNNPDSPFIKYGKRVMGNLDEKSTIWTKLRTAWRLFVFLVVPVWIIPILAKLGIQVFDKEAVDYFGDVTNRILDDRSVDESKRRDFVQLSVDQLVEVKDGDPDTKTDEYGNQWSEKGLTRQEIVGNAVLFFLAGYETTATSLQFFFYEMAYHTKIQEELYEEMTTVCSTSTPSYEELSKLGLLDRCLEETMRLYPAGFRFDRDVSQDVTINGVFIPAGSNIAAGVFAIHHDPELWPDPEEFDPDRFTAENKEGRHPCAWIPFGIGNRNCVGMRLALLEMKIACVKILWNFKIEKCDETPARPIKFAAKLGFTPEDPIIVTAVSRS